MSDNTNKGNNAHKWFPMLLAVLALLAIIVNKINEDKTDTDTGSNNGNVGGSTNTSVQQSRPDDKVLAAVPAELRDNFFLGQKEMGCCKTLSGNVAVTVVMVSDSVGQWDAESEANLKTALKSAGQDIIADAAACNTELSLSFHYYNAAMTGDVCNGKNNDGWQDDALQKAGLPPLDDLHNYLIEKYDSKEAPVVFVFNKTGRSFARSGKNEYFILYAEKNFKAFQHELSHVFGAKDYYYPEAVKTLASKLFTDSIMSDGETVDSFTAYLIGWSNTISVETLQFLMSTKEITAEQMKEANEDELFTGYGTKEMNAGTYTGDLLRGECHGSGTMQYDNGGWYSGGWSHGAMSGNGTGKLVYDNGVYEGEFLDGKRHGQGTYTYANGGWYKGQWKEGSQSGYGTGKSVYDNGVYEGEFYNGKRHGQGTYTWSNGGWITGNWSNGEQVGAGRGKKIHDNGVYEGEFYNGNRHGQGTYAWSNGNKYTGQWANGEMSGYGTYTYANGKVRTGNWSNGKFVG